VSQVTVQLGEHEYTVHPQRHAYLRHRLGDKIELLGQNLNLIADGNFLDQIVDQAYEFLSVFIPEMMPQWEFEGYGTPEAFEARSYDEAADRSPTTGQIIGAFEAALRVNRLDLVKHLKGPLQTLLGDDYLAAQLKVGVGTMTERALGDSPSSPPENGASAQTSSGQDAPTPMLSSVPDTGSDSPSSDSPN
jgi:hypothetical protein